MRHIGKALLGGKDVAFQPGQEFQPVGGHCLVLGQMGMQIHQARQDPEGSQILHRQFGMAGRHYLEGPCVGDAPLPVHHEPAVGLEMKLLEGGCGEQGCTEKHEKLPLTGPGPERRKESPSTPAQAVDQFLGRVEATPVT